MDHDRLSGFGELGAIFTGVGLVLLLAFAFLLRPGRVRSSSGV